MNRTSSSVSATDFIVQHPTANLPSSMVFLSEPEDHVCTARDLALSPVPPAQAGDRSCLYRRGAEQTVWSRNITTVPPHYTPQVLWNPFARAHQCHVPCFELFFQSHNVPVFVSLSVETSILFSWCSSRLGKWLHF